MALDVTTALTTVDNVAAELCITPDASDRALIEKKIKAASAAAAKFIGRPLGFEAGIVEVVKGYGSTVRIQVRRRPIYQVTEVLLPGEEATTAFVLDDEGRLGSISFTDGRAPWTGFLGPGVMPDLMPDTEIASPDLIQVTYDAGWVLPGQTGTPADATALPDDIREAVDVAVAHMIRRKDRDLDIQSERLLSEQTTYVDRAKLVGLNGALAGWPVEAAAVLQAYRQIAQA